MDLRGKTIRHQFRLDGQAIHGDVLCQDAIFTKQIDFSGVSIGGEMDFRGARFGAYARFAHIHASNVRCTEASFEWDAYVSIFSARRISFARATFGGAVTMHSTNAKDVDLRRATFHHRAALHFDDVETVALERASFDRGVRLSATGPTWIDLIEVDLGAPSSISASAETVSAWKLTDRPLLGRTVGTDLSMLQLSHVDLSRCSFAGAHNLDKITIDDWHGWRTTPRSFWVTHRVTLADEHRVRRADRWAIPDDTVDAPPADSVQGDYHALRSMMQDRHDQRAASDFYYGEMELRRMALWRTLRARLRERRWRPAASAAGEWVLVLLYWLLSGYGQRAWRAFASLAVVLVATGAALSRWGFATPTSFGDALRYTVRAATTLLRGPDADLTPAGDWIEIGLRLVAPLLLALGLLAIRERVRR